MNKYFTYSVLNYVHSQFLEEKLNVGILFHFLPSNRVIFKYPRGLKRIKDLYSDFEEWQLKTYLSAIDDKVTQLNKRLPSTKNNLFSNEIYESIVSSDILRNDATVLSFSEIKKALIYDDNEDKIATEFYNLYFSSYTEIITIKEKHDEDYLKKYFSKNLFLKNQNSQNLIRKDITIDSPDTSVKFDYKWRNGVENLVKSVGFDLEDESTINHKAILLHGQLSFIEDTINKSNTNIDIIISQPSLRKDRKLVKAYSKALEIIDKAKIKKSIIEEDKLDAYIDTVAAQIKPLQ